jgi:small ligand-binding sensory domain FIST
VPTVAAALSTHPVPAIAVGEVVGQVLDQIGPAPDLVVLFASAAHVGALEDVARAVADLLSPGVFVGTTAAMVAGGAIEVEDAPALSLWAARGLRATGHRLDHRQALPALDDGSDALLVLADPYSYDPQPLLDAAGGVPVVGGMASSARGPGGNRIILDGRIHADGGVVVQLAGVGVVTVVSQGCKPVGQPMTVTRVSGNLLEELAGRPALERVQETIGTLAPEDLERARQGLHLGRVVDEHRDRFRTGDFLVRNVLGGDSQRGAVAVNDEIELGTTVQLHVRDATTADDDLRERLRGRRADGALLFTCNGRGTPLFGGPDHDAGLVAELLGDPALAGMSCAGELGPVGGRSFLHGFTASLLLL